MVRTGLLTLLVAIAATAIGLERAGRWVVGALFRAVVKAAGP